MATPGKPELRYWIVLGPLFVIGKPGVVPRCYLGTQTPKRCMDATCVL